MAASITLIGNTTADIELRYTRKGTPVGSVTIAVSDRTKDASGNWVDGDTWFARCTLWGDLAEHAVGAVPKGTRVIASGKVRQREWEDRDGNKRVSVEVVVDELGPSLRYATAQVTRTTQKPHAPATSPNSMGWHSSEGQQFSSPQTGTQGGWASGNYETEPPF